MQALQAFPRQGLTQRDVYRLLHADDLKVASWGAELLDTNDQVVGELGRDLRSALVSWDGSLDIHRSAELEVGRELAWDRDRLRLYREVRSDLVGVRARFYRGVFIPTRPTAAVDGSRVVVHKVTAWDKLRLLRSPVGDTWSTNWALTGQTTYLGAEVRRILAAAGWRSAFVMPPAAETTLLKEPMVWPLDDGATTYLRVLIDLLAAAGFTEPYVDELGVGHADLITPLPERPTEWTLDFDDPRWTLVGRQRQADGDLGEIPNQWRFINSNLDREPVIGDGIFDAEDNDSLGPTSINARDFRLKAVRKINASDQAALERIGREQRAEDIRASRVRSIEVAPLPILGHRDVIELRDQALGGAVRAVATKWGPEDLSARSTRTPVVLQEAIA